MNQAEYKSFFLDLSRYLPNVAVWLNDLAKIQQQNEPGTRTIHTVWAEELLGDCTPEECRPVLRRIASQDVELKSWQDLPGVIRREVTNRRPKPKSEYLQDVGQKFVVTGDISQAYKELRQCENAGAD